MAFFVCFTMSSFKNVHHKVFESDLSLLGQGDSTPPPKLSAGQSSRGILEGGKYFPQLISVSNPFLNTILRKNLITATIYSTFTPLCMYVCM